MKKPIYNNINLIDKTNKNENYIQNMDNLPDVINDKKKSKKNYSKIKNFNNNEKLFYDKINKSHINLSRNYKNKEHNKDLFYKTEFDEIEAEYGDKNKQKKRLNINNKKTNEDIKQLTRKKKFVSLNIKSLKYPCLLDKYKEKKNSENENNIEN